MGNEVDHHFLQINQTKQIASQINFAIDSHCGFHIVEGRTEVRMV